MMKGCLDSLYCKKNEKMSILPHQGTQPSLSEEQLPRALYYCTAKWLMYFKQASLVAQLVKNLPVVQETLVRFLSWEDPLKKG